MSNTQKINKLSEDIIEDLIYAKNYNSQMQVFEHVLFKWLLLPYAVITSYKINWISFTPTGNHCEYDSADSG